MLALVICAVVTFFYGFSLKCRYKITTWIAKAIMVRLMGSSVWRSLLGVVAANVLKFCSKSCLKKNFAYCCSWFVEFLCLQSPT